MLHQRTLFYYTKIKHYNIACVVKMTNDRIPLPEGGNRQRDEVHIPFYQGLLCPPGAKASEIL